MLFTIFFSKGLVCNLFDLCVYPCLIGMFYLLVIIYEEFFDVVVHYGGIFLNNDRVRYWS